VVGHDDIGVDFHPVALPNVVEAADDDLGEFGSVKDGFVIYHRGGYKVEMLRVKVCLLTSHVYSI